MTDAIEHTLTQDWETEIAGTPMGESIAHARQVIASKAMPLFRKKSGFRQEARDNTAVHAWAVAAELAELQEKWQNSPLPDLREVVAKEIARIIGPHLKDSSFMSIVIKKAQDSLASQG